MLFEFLVVERDRSETPATWFQGEERLCDDSQESFQKLLNAYGQQGFRLSAVCDDGDRLIFERMTMKPIEIVEKVKKKGIGDDD